MNEDYEPGNNIERDCLLASYVVIGVSDIEYLYATALEKWEGDMDNELSFKQAYHLLDEVLQETSPDDIFSELPSNVQSIFDNKSETDRLQDTDTLIIIEEW